MGLHAYSAYNSGGVDRPHAGINEYMRSGRHLLRATAQADRKQVALRAMLTSSRINAASGESTLSRVFEGNREVESALRLNRPNNAEVTNLEFIFQRQQYGVVEFFRNTGRM